MEDEQVEQEQPSQRTIEVVSYDVVRGVVDSAAQEASDAAVNDVVGRIEHVSDELSGTVDDVAEAAAAGAADRAVREVMAKGAEDGAEGDSGSVTYTIQIDSTQYDALMLAQRRQLGVSFLTLCLVGACLGVLLWGFVSREFR